MTDTLKMTDLPESERPYEKCLAAGPGVLSDAELLAVILRSGAPGMNSRDLATRILLMLKERGGLTSLPEVRTSELMRLPGIGKVKAIQLQCIGELSARIARTKARGSIRLDQPETIANYFMEDMRVLPQEEVRAVFLGNKGQLIAWEQITRGTVNASLASPREIFVAALRHGAVLLVLLHNHPSGDPTPSEEDYILTDRLSEAGRLLSVPLLDHIIIGDLTFFSFRECGYLT